MSAVLAVGVGGCAALGMGFPSEKVVIRRILSSSVQVVVEKGGQRIRTGSGVVVGAVPVAQGTDCLVMTSGHTFARLTGPSEVYVLLGRHTGAGTRARATVVVQQETDLFDLALLRAQTRECQPAQVGTVPTLGDAVWVVGFPWGRHMRLVSGTVSQVTLEPVGGLDGAARLMVDASVASGVSGGGVFEARTGRLVGVVEGYGTARVPFGEKPSPQYIDVPVPGETYVTSLLAIRRFLSVAGYPDLLDGSRFPSR